MDAGLFDVLHDAADDRDAAVADGVHVHFDGVFQELVDEDGMLRRCYQGPIHEVDQGRIVGNDLHGPPP